MSVGNFVSVSVKAALAWTSYTSAISDELEEVSDYAAVSSVVWESYFSSDADFGLSPGLYIETWPFECTLIPRLIWSLSKS